MTKKLVNNIQQKVSTKINNLIKGNEAKSLNESTIVPFDKTGKFLIGKKIAKINKLAKYIIKEAAFKIEPKNIRLAEYEVYANQPTGFVICFILPNDEPYIESKNGRTFEFNVQDFVDFLEEIIDISTWITSDPNEPSSKYFDFEGYWSQINEVLKADNLKAFTANYINTTGKIPELT